jgi:transcriptional regulator with XRE-family HTH domain
MTFSEKIKTLRKEYNWKQEELAEKINTDARQVSLYENEKSSPSIETVIKIAKAFNVSIDYLLIEEANKRPLILNDEKTFENLKKVELLPDDEKAAIFKIIDGLVYKNKLKKAFNEVD